MLSQRKVEQVLASQSNTARKLYEIMTTENKWNVHQVVAEFKKVNNGNTPDRRVLSGCLNDLTDSGLLKRTGADLYNKAPVRKPANPTGDMIARVTDPIATNNRSSVPGIADVAAKHPRVAVKPPVQPPVKEIEVMSKQHPVSKPVAKPVQDPMTAMLSVATEMTTMANTMLSMAKNIEDMALELQIEREKSREKNEKVEKLTEILKSFQND
jgi:hypothetical protein